MDDVTGAPAPRTANSTLSSAPSSVPCPVPWLALALAAPLTPVVCRRLRESFADPERLGRALVDALGAARPAARAARVLLGAPRGPLSPTHVAALDAPLTGRRVAETLDWLARDPRHHVLPIDDPRYPAALRASLDPPPLLWLHGDPAALRGPAVAIVGARDATHAGRELARELGRELAASGLVVVSGLALGTDGAAHAGALEGGGTTLAFTATGLDTVYPRRHASLARAMLERGGALASEFPLRHPPQPWCFPQRNRLISGASLGVVVVEAALPSGSLTTARHALEQGRDVMAVPGAVGNPKSAGCHALIRDGAALVTSATDVLQVLEGPLRRALDEPAHATASVRRTSVPTDSPAVAASTDVPATPPAPRDSRSAAASAAPSAGAVERHVWQCLEGASATLEQLVARSGLGVPVLLAALGELELAGRVVVERGGRYARCRRG